MGEKMTETKTIMLQDFEGIERDINDAAVKRKEKFNLWIKYKMPDGLTCESCGSKSWTTETHGLVNVPAPNQLCGVSYPCVLTICDNCGNTKLFNAVMMGVE